MIAIVVSKADLRCGTVVEAAQRFARDKSCFYFDSQREIEKPLALKRMLRWRSRDLDLHGLPGGGEVADRQGLGDPLAAMG
eukprot:symbB.v1.2.000106.t1/scaffold13.1/size649204/17